MYIKSFVRVFTDFRYIALALGITLLLFVFSAYLMNHGFVSFVLNSTHYTFFERCHLIWTIFPTFFNSTKGISFIFTSLAFILSGFNVALLTFYIRHRVKQQRAVGIGLLGIIIGMFGVGCGACGSVILTTTLGVVTGTKLLGSLPFAGLEFSALSIIIVLASSWYLLKTINNPNVCPIK